MASFCGTPSGEPDDSGPEPESGTGGPTFPHPACDRWLQATQDTGMLDWGSLAVAINEDIGEAVKLALSPDPLDSLEYQAFLANTAKDCRADDRPCPGCCAGGICDGPGRRSDDAHEDDYEEDSA